MPTGKMPAHGGQGFSLQCTILTRQGRGRRVTFGLLFRTGCELKLQARQLSPLSLINWRHLDSPAPAPVSHQCARRKETGTGQADLGGSQHKDRKRRSPWRQDGQYGQQQATKRNSVDTRTSSGHVYFTVDCSICHATEKLARGPEAGRRQNANVTMIGRPLVHCCCLSKNQQMDSLSGKKPRFRGISLFFPEGCFPSVYYLPDWLEPLSQSMHCRHPSLQSPNFSSVKRRQYIRGNY